MKTKIKSVIITSFLSAAVFGGETNPTKQEIEERLKTKNSYEYNLMGKRLLRPIDDGLLKLLAAQPEKSRDHDYILTTWLVRIAAEADRKYLWLLDSKGLRSDGNPFNEEIGAILLAYDYNVNGNQKALDTLLGSLRKSMQEHGTWGLPQLFALAAVNEWDRCRQVFGSQELSADGAGDDERYGFWLKRRYFFPKNNSFPDNYAAFCRDLEQLQSKAESGPGE